MAVLVCLPTNECLYPDFPGAVAPVKTEATSGGVLSSVSVINKQSWNL